MIFSTRFTRQHTYSMLSNTSLQRMDLSQHHQYRPLTCHCTLYMLTFLCYHSLNLESHRNRPISDWQVTGRRTGKKLSRLQLGGSRHLDLWWDEAQQQSQVQFVMIPALQELTGLHQFGSWKAGHEFYDRQTGIGESYGQTIKHMQTISRLDGLRVFPNNLASAKYTCSSLTSIISAKYVG